MPRNKLQPLTCFFPLVKLVTLLNCTAFACSKDNNKNRTWRSQEIKAWERNPISVFGSLIMKVCDTKTQLWIKEVRDRGFYREKKTWDYTWERKLRWSHAHLAICRLFFSLPKSKSLLLSHCVCHALFGKVFSNIMNHWLIAQSGLSLYFISLLEPLPMFCRTIEYHVDFGMNIEEKKGGKNIKSKNSSSLVTNNLFLKK